MNPALHYPPKAFSPLGVAALAGAIVHGVHVRRQGARAQPRVEALHPGLEQKGGGEFV
jgi:hypothetical protein